MKPLKDKLRDLYATDLPYRDFLSLENGNEYKDSSDSGDFKDIASGRERSREFDELFETEEYVRVQGDHIGVRESEPDRKKPKVEVSKILIGTFSKKLEIIREAIEEINEEIDKRMEISREFGVEVDEKIRNLEFELGELGRWQLGHNQSIEFRRLGLERDLLTLKK